MQRTRAISIPAPCKIAVDMSRLLHQKAIPVRRIKQRYMPIPIGQPAENPRLRRVQMYHIRANFLRNGQEFEQRPDVFGKADGTDKMLDFDHLDARIKIIPIVFRRLRAHRISQIEFIVLDKAIGQIDNVRNTPPPIASTTKSSRFLYSLVVSLSTLFTSLNWESHRPQSSFAIKSVLAACLPQPISPY